MKGRASFNRVGGGQAEAGLRVRFMFLEHWPSLCLRCAMYTVPFVMPVSLCAVPRLSLVHAEWGIHCRSVCLTATR
jgi:hypothetical protein